MLCYAMLRYTIRFHDTTCHAMLHVMLCNAMLCMDSFPGSWYIFHHFNFPVCFFSLPGKSRDLKIYFKNPEILDYIAKITFAKVSVVYYLMCRNRCQNRQHITLCNFVSDPILVLFLSLLQRILVLGDSVGLFDTITKT